MSNPIETPTKNKVLAKQFFIAISFDPDIADYTVVLDNYSYSYRGYVVRYVGNIGYPQSRSELIMSA